MASRIGRRNKRVQIQSVTTTKGRMQEVEKTYTTVATVWGYVRSPNGKEVEQASQQKALVTHVAECNWPGSLVTVTPRHRLVVEGAAYNVASAVDPDGRKTTLNVSCTEVVAPRSPNE